eukprot:COSAG01_NODE_2441_length_7690_cov_241.628903_5_plen_153_part_00
MQPLCLRAVGGTDKCSLGIAAANTHSILFDDGATRKISLQRSGNKKRPFRVREDSYGTTGGLTALQEAFHLAQDRFGMHTSFLLTKDLSSVEPEPEPEPQGKDAFRIMIDPTEHPRLCDREVDVYTLRGKSLDELKRSISKEFGIQVRAGLS